MKRMETYQASMSLGEESSQMWSLNKRLESYLSRVKSLEEENEMLRVEIHHLKSTRSESSLMRKYHDEIMKLRDALDDGHQEMIQVEMARDDIHQEIQYVKELCLQEQQARKDIKKELSESQKMLEEEQRAQIWLKDRLVQLHEELEDILTAHEEEKALMEDEISSYSQRLGSFKVAPVAFKPVNVEDYASKLSQIWQGAVEEYKDEVSALETSLFQINENLRKVLDENKQSQLQLQNLDRELQSLRERKDLLEELLSQQWQDQQEEEGKLQLEMEALEKEKQDLRVQISQVLEDRQQLMHLKMSLCLEVATYRSMLEAESTRIYSPSVDYKVSSSFNDSVLERKALRKRQADNRDYKLNANKKQSAETSTPNRYINVKSTSYSSRTSPVTKEFQKVSSVLQSQSLKSAKASSTKGATLLPTVKRSLERCAQTGDVFKKSTVDTISHSCTRDSSKAVTEETVRNDSNDYHVLNRNIYQTIDTRLKETEFLGGVESSQYKTDLLESSSKTVGKHDQVISGFELEEQENSLKVQNKDLDTHFYETPHTDKSGLDVPHAVIDSPCQSIENILAEHFIDKQEDLGEIVSCQKVYFEKQEIVESLQYQNTETTIKGTDERHGEVLDFTDLITADTDNSLASSQIKEQEKISSVEMEEPKLFLSDGVSDHGLGSCKDDFNDTVSFDTEHVVGSLSDSTEDTNQWANQEEEHLQLNEGLDINIGEQDTSNLKQFETESDLKEEDETVCQQFHGLSALKDNSNQLFDNEEDITSERQEEQTDTDADTEEVSQELSNLENDKKSSRDEDMFDGPQSFDIKHAVDQWTDGKLESLQPDQGFELSDPEHHIDNIKPEVAESHLSEEVTTYQEVHVLSVVRDDNQLIDKEIQEAEDDYQEQENRALGEEQERDNISDTERITHRSSDNEIFIQANDYQDIVNQLNDVYQDNNQVSEDFKNIQLASQEEEENIKFNDLEENIQVSDEQQISEIIKVTEEATEELYVIDQAMQCYSDEEDTDQLNDIQQESNQLSEKVEDSQQPSKKDPENLDLINTEGSHIVHSSGGNGEECIDKDQVIQTLEVEDVASWSSTIKQDTYQLSENDSDIQDLQEVEQKSCKQSDSEPDNSNLADEQDAHLPEDTKMSHVIDDAEVSGEELSNEDTNAQLVDEKQDELRDATDNKNTLSDKEVEDRLQDNQEIQNKIELIDAEHQTVKLMSELYRQMPEGEKRSLDVTDAEEVKQLEGDEQTNLLIGNPENNDTTAQSFELEVEGDSTPTSKVEENQLSEKNGEESLMGSDNTENITELKEPELSIQKLGDYTSVNEEELVSLTSGVAELHNNHTEAKVSVQQKGENDYINHENYDIVDETKESVKKEYDSEQCVAEEDRSLLTSTESQSQLLGHEAEESLIRSDNTENDSQLNEPEPINHDDFTEEKLESHNTDPVAEVASDHLRDTEATVSVLQESEDLSQTGGENKSQETDQVVLITEEYSEDIERIKQSVQNDSDYVEDNGFTQTHVAQDSQLPENETELEPEGRHVEDPEKVSGNDHLSDTEVKISSQQDTEDENVNQLVGETELNQENFEIVEEAKESVQKEYDTEQCVAEEDRSLLTGTELQSQLLGHEEEESLIKRDNRENDSQLNEPEPIIQDDSEACIDRNTEEKLQDNNVDNTDQVSEVDNDLLRDTEAIVSVLQESENLSQTSGEREEKDQLVLTTDVYSASEDTELIKQSVENDSDVVEGCGMTQTHAAQDSKLPKNETEEKLEDNNMDNTDQVSEVDNDHLIDTETTVNVLQESEVLSQTGEENEAKAQLVLTTEEYSASEDIKVIKQSVENYSDVIEDNKSTQTHAAQDSRLPENETEVEPDGHNVEAPKSVPDNDHLSYTEVKISSQQETEEGHFNQSVGETELIQENVEIEEETKQSVQKEYDIEQCVAEEDRYLLTGTEPQNQLQGHEEEESLIRSDNTGTDSQLNELEPTIQDDSEACIDRNTEEKLESHNVDNTDHASKIDNDHLIDTETKVNVLQESEDLSQAGGEREVIGQEVFTTEEYSASEENEIIKQSVHNDSDVVVDTESTQTHVAKDSQLPENETEVDLDGHNVEVPEPVPDNDHLSETEAEISSQQDTEDEHLNQSGGDKELCQDSFEIVEEAKQLLQKEYDTEQCVAEEERSLLTSTEPQSQLLGYTAEESLIRSGNTENDSQLKEPETIIQDDSEVCIDRNTEEKLERPNIDNTDPVLEIDSDKLRDTEATVSVLQESEDLSQTGEEKESQEVDQVVLTTEKYSTSEENKIIKQLVQYDSDVVGNNESTQTHVAQDSQLPENETEVDPDGHNMEVPEPVLDNDHLSDTEAKISSQQETEDEHLNQSGGETEIIQENFDIIEVAKESTQNEYDTEQCVAKEDRSLLTGREPQSQLLGHQAEESLIRSDNTDTDSQLNEPEPSNQDDSVAYTDRNTAEKLESHNIDNTDQDSGVDNYHLRDTEAKVSVLQGAEELSQTDGEKEVISHLVFTTEEYSASEDTEIIQQSVPNDSDVVEDNESTQTNTAHDSQLPETETEVEFDGYNVEVPEPVPNNDHVSDMEDKISSQQDIDDGHLNQSDRVKGDGEESSEARSTVKEYTVSNENDEINQTVQKESGVEQNIVFSLNIIQSNLRLTSEIDGETEPSDELCEEKAESSENSNLDNCDIKRNNLIVEETVSEDKEIVEEEQKQGNIETENLRSESIHQDFPAEQHGPSNLDKEYETKCTEHQNNEDWVEEPTVLFGTKCENILVEHKKSQELLEENPPEILDTEGPTEHQEEIEDIPAASNITDETSISDESLCSQDISICSQKSEDFEISKDYQLEQTLPDTTPLPNLDDEFDELADNEVISASGQPEDVTEPQVPEYRAEKEQDKVLDSRLESQSSQLVTGENEQSISSKENEACNIELEYNEEEAERPKVQFETDEADKLEEQKQEPDFLAENLSEVLNDDKPVLEQQKRHEDLAVGTLENENSESEESMNSQEEVSMYSLQGEKTQLDTTPSSDLMEKLEKLAEDRQQFTSQLEQRITVDEGTIEKTCLTEATELDSPSKHSETEFVPDTDTTTVTGDTTVALNQDLENADSIEKEDYILKTQIGQVTEGNILEKETELDNENNKTEHSNKVHIKDTQNESEESELELTDVHMEKESTIEPSHEVKDIISTDVHIILSEESEIQYKISVDSPQEDVKVENIISESEVSSDEGSPNVTTVHDIPQPQDERDRITEDADIGGEVVQISKELERTEFEDMEIKDTHEGETLSTFELVPSSSPSEPSESQTSDEDKDTTGESSDSSFDSYTAFERGDKAISESTTEHQIDNNTVNGLHKHTVIQATLDLEDHMFNGHSKKQHSEIVISERKTTVRWESDSAHEHVRDILEDPVIKFAMLKGKTEGLFQSAHETSAHEEVSQLDEGTEIKYTVYAADGYDESAANESNYTKKVINPYLSDKDFNDQSQIKSSLVHEDITEDTNTNQESSETLLGLKFNQEREDLWSSDE